MEPIRKPEIAEYSLASTLEWLEADGMGGIASSSIINANTRKQHGLLSAESDAGGRAVLLACVQETVIDGNRQLELSTNSYFGAIHPAGYLALESFNPAPWPTWRYAFDDIAIEKQVFMARGEHTVIISYTLTGIDRPARLIVRPLVAYRNQSALRSERGCFPDNWHASGEFVELQPFPDAPTLFIAHPEGIVETVGLWYRGFVYERDRESHFDCSEDLYSPGYFEVPLNPGEPCAFVFSTPSPKSIEHVDAYMRAERARRKSATEIDGIPEDPFLADLLHAADAFVYENPQGWPAIDAGLPWGEAHVYRGLIAFSGLLLPKRRFEAACEYLRGIAARWRATQAPSQFEPSRVPGHAHPADAPLWVSIAAWRYWKAAGNSEFLFDEFLPFLDELAQYYLDGGEVRPTGQGLLEVGYEPDAGYQPVLPLGTNALWYNAQCILADLNHVKGASQDAAAWQSRARRTAMALRDVFACQVREGVADAVTLTPLRRDETVRAGQVLAVGLPFCPLDDPLPTVQLIREHLATPFGPRSLSRKDSRYTGNGDDVRFFPKCWFGSVDAIWFGLYRDALTRVGLPPSDANDFDPFRTELAARGYGHISGAFAGDTPHTPLDYVASAGALGEVLRIYAKEILQLAYIV